MIERIGNMPRIMNYDKNESLATGFVKPKITSLFFDKIWVPESLILSSQQYYYIPDEVLIIEPEEMVLDIDRIKVGIRYDYATNENCYLRPGVFYSIMRHSNTGLPITDFPIEQYSEDSPVFLYSKNRNNAIFVSAENFCRLYNTHISPVFHSLTEFELETQLIRERQLTNPESVKEEDTFVNENAITISIQDFPSIIEEELSWEQVLDIRKDKKNKERLKRFTEWSSKNLNTKSPEEIRETLEYELEEYKKAIKEHGIKTVAGAFSTLISTASSLCSIFENAQSCLLPMLSVTSVAITFSVNTHFSNIKSKNNPIAYLYDITRE